MRHPDTYLSGGATSETRNIAGTKAASHRWTISDGSKPAQTTTPVAADYCPEITWTDSSPCSASADIVGTKTTGICDPGGDHQWSLGVQIGAPSRIACPAEGWMESIVFNSQLLGTPGLGACYVAGEVNNYEWVIPWTQCSRDTDGGLELIIAPMGEAVVWMAQTCVPVP